MSTSTQDGPVVEVEAVADALVDVVVRPDDAAAVRASIDRVGPTDLAGLVAVVDDHQPMTLEVVVDVLAELGCPPAAIADAVAADLPDVHVLLGIDPSPPPSALSDGPRVIDLGGAPTATGPDQVLAVDLERVDPDPSDDAVSGHGRGDVDAGDPDEAASSPARHVVDPSDDDEGDEPVGTDEPSIVVIGGATTDEAEADEPAPTPDEAPTPGAERDHATPGRPRIAWAVALFVLLVGGAIALAALLGAF